MGRKEDGAAAEIGDGDGAVAEKEGGDVDRRTEVDEDWRERDKGEKGPEKSGLDRVTAERACIVWRGSAG